MVLLSSVDVALMNRVLGAGIPVTAGNSTAIELSEDAVMRRELENDGMTGIVSAEEMAGPSDDVVPIVEMIVLSADDVSGKDVEAVGPPSIVVDAKIEGVPGTAVEEVSRKPE